MTSLDSARAGLRAALERSAVARFLRESKAAWADAWTRGRGLSAEEVGGLEARGNFCADWSSVRLLGPSSLESIRNCRFEGQILLRLESGPAILWNSRIRDAVLGAVTIENAHLVRRVWIEDGAFLSNVGEVSGRRGSNFCLGKTLAPGSETGGRRVFLMDGLLLSDCAAMAALSPAEQGHLAAELGAEIALLGADHAYVGAKARIESTTTVEDTFVGAGASIRGSTLIRNSVIASTLEDPAHLGHGALIMESVLEPGVAVHSAAQVRHSILLEYSRVTRAAQIADSVIGPNTHAAKGEITASLVGPFVGFHHQALLIGALWPEGRGNVAYGANVGSNHTGRKPDQELKPGEGTFFGLGCSIKFPANYEAAPHSLFASGVIAPPQKIAFPFSLILPATDPEAPGLNEIQPGWMWSENAYALARNAYKYADRNHAQRHVFPEMKPPAGSPLEGSFLAADLFGPGTVDHVIKALQAFPKFSQIKSKGVYVASEIEGLGANFLRGPRLTKARAAYLNYLGFALCRLLLWNPGASVKLSDAGRPLLKALGLTDEKTLDIETLFHGFTESVETSLAKDTARGQAIFDDYDAFHPEPASDAVCARLRADLDRLLPDLRRRIG